MTRRSRVILGIRIPSSPREWLLSGGVLMASAATEAPG
jgi:hypothetical protein